MRLPVPPVLSCLSLAAALVVGAPASASGSPAPASVAAPIDVGGLGTTARVEGGRLAAAESGRFRARFWAGVNLGSTVPGTLPGEVAATRPTYDRWLHGMGALGVNVVRVYTILRPDFYAALAAYDAAHPTRPLYLVQGVWIPEDELARTRDLYDPAVADGFRAEIRDAVAVVHGRADLPARRGHASGRYRSDVSRWLLAWSLGVEWDPELTAASDARNAGRSAFTGRYVASDPGSTPTETWLAQMLDFAATEEAARGTSRPLTFTNWLTTDPLHHPDEWLPTEDAVSIDATHLHATEAWPGGLFASYHAYPYYPDFLGLEPGLQGYRRRRDGVVDPYAGYLHALAEHHRARGQAVMITELGVPSGLGIAHSGPLGRNQGGHSERGQGRIDADLLRDVHDEGLAGGVVFEYVDEWFKLSWNTRDLEQPGDRRQLWPNPLTNEEHFGLVAADPGARPVVVVDGADREWARNGSVPIAPAAAGVPDVRAVADEGYLYLRLRLAGPAPWRSRRLQIGFDVRPGGNRGLPGRRGLMPRADVALTVGPGRRAELQQAAWTDPVSFRYGQARGFVPYRAADLRVGSGAWLRPRLMLNFPHAVPTTGRLVPTELVDVGRLRWGTADPRSRAFDDRTLVAGRGRVLELRIPWMLLTVSDPSSHRVYVPRSDGSVGSRRVGRIGIGLALGGRGLVATRGFGWRDWSSVRWHERRKAGWTAVAAAVAETVGS